MKFKLFFWTSVGFLLLLFGKNVLADDDILWHNEYGGDKVFFNSTGTRLAISILQSYPSLVDPATGLLLKTFDMIYGSSSQKFSHNGNIFASSSSKGIYFIDAKTLDTIRISKVQSTFFDFTNDDDYFITANLSVAGIFINKYDIKTDSLISSFKFLFTPNKYDISMNDFAVSPIGNNIAFSGTELYSAHLYGQFNKIIDLDSKKIIGDFSDPYSINSLPFFKYSRNGILAAIDSDKVNFYDGNSKIIKTLKDSNYIFNDFCLNEDENEIITCSYSRGIKIWDYNTLQLKKWYNNPTLKYSITKVAFDNSKKILIAQSDGLYAFDYSKIVSVNDNGSIQPVINIVPNPTVNQVTINIQNENIMNINLIISDLTGKSIISKDYLNINSNVFNTSFNTSNLPSGTLFFNLTIDGKLFTKQVIIIK